MQIGWSQKVLSSVPVGDSHVIISDPHGSLKGMGGEEVVCWGQGTTQSPPAVPSSTLIMRLEKEAAMVSHMPEDLAPVWSHPHLHGKNPTQKKGQGTWDKGICMLGEFKFHLCFWSEADLVFSLHGHPHFLPAHHTYTQRY